MLCTLAGGEWLLALVLAHGTDLTLWALTPAILVTGVGMGACFGTIFDLALGHRPGSRLTLSRAAGRGSS